MVIVSDVLRKNMEVYIVGSFENLVNYPCALGGVGLHDLKLLVREASGLAQYGIVYRDLSEIMHRRGFDKITAELLRKSEIIAAFYDLIDQYADNIAGASDMPAGGVVTAFYHCRHARYEPVVHLGKVRGLHFDLLLEIGVVCVQQ